MVHILIPAHNNRLEVIALLQCLERQQGVEQQVVLIDDGSVDETVETVNGRFPTVSVLRGDGNLWWTGANVLGVAHVRNGARDRDFILLLNNDVTVGKDYVAELVRCSEKLGRAIVGSTVVDHEHPERIVAGLRMDRRLRVTENSDAVVIGKTEYDDQVDVLPGRGMLVPIEVFDRIGTFDHRRLPHYGADYEFSIRAKRAGFTLAVSHRAKAYANFRITGWHLPDRATLSMKESLQLLFSRKSTANLLYYLRYVWLCSEPDCKVRNTFSQGLGLLLNTIGKTTLGVPIAACVRFCLKSARKFKAL
ncbi:MAG: glycosyltransferase family 2 protein [Nitrospiraceae bacterium]